MIYMKFNAVDRDSQFVFFNYRDYENKEAKPISLAIPLDKFRTIETDFSLLDGDVTTIYLEEPSKIYQKIWLDGKHEELTEAEKELCRAYVIKACVDNAYDSLTKPPSLDQDVEQFIKDFFKDTQQTTQKDFIEDFFKEVDAATPKE